MSKIGFIRKKYLNNGLKIFPIKPNEKVPMINAWQKECSNYFMQVVYWLNNVPECNIGLPANENNLFILDLDTHNVNGLESFERLCQDLGIEEPKTLKQKTPSGGVHYIFKSDSELSNVVNCANCFDNYKGIDLRTSGYIVVEPSVINGKKYEFLNNLTPSEMPIKLKEFILENVGVKTSEKKPYSRPKKVDVGDRDNQMFLYINDLYYHTRLDEDEIRILAEYFNESVLEKPLPERVIDYKIRKVFQKDRGSCLFIKLNEEE